LNAGEPAAAFRAAHARSVEAVSEANTLLDIARGNLGEAGGTYVATDSAAAAF
jgi:hypothetical protein